MNDTTPPPGESGPASERTSDRFFGWLRGLGIMRTTSDRWFAGVAAGIAGRANIDPLIVRGIFNVLRQINAEGGVSILLIEQNANLALDLADDAYLLESGRIVLSGTSAEMRDNADIRKSYLGID